MYFCWELNFVLFHVKFLPAKIGCKTKVAFILKYLTAKCACQPKLAARKKRIDSQNQLPAKIGYMSRMDASPKTSRPKWLYPKLAVKSVYLPKVAASQKQLPAKYWSKPKVAARQKGLPAKRGSQPKASASQILMHAKKNCQAKRAASQKWLPANYGCQPVAATVQEIPFFFWILHLGSQFRILKLCSQPNKYFVEPCQWQFPFQPSLPLQE